jgi:hypothetical protein
MASERDTSVPIVVRDVSSFHSSTPTKAEIERRRHVVDHMRWRREKIGTVDLTIAELLSDDDDRGSGDDQPSKS